MIRYQTRARKQIRERIDGTAVVGLILAYTVVVGLFTLWFYPLAQARYGSNPGLAAYHPPPATVVPDMPAHLVAEQHQAPPPVAIQSRPEQPRTTAPAVTGAPEAIRALASTDAFASTEPAAAAASPPPHAVKARKPTHSRSSPPPRERQSPTRAAAAAYPGYSGGRPF